MTGKSPQRLKLPIFFLSIAVLLALTANSRAIEYYVAKNGKDSNPGTEAQPWLTVQKGANEAVAGDTVYVKSGTYTEVVTIANSGASGNFITFKEYPGDTVILDGTGNAGWWGVITIHGKDYIKLEGFEIRNNSTGWGLLIEHEVGDVNNPATYIELSGLEVHHTGGEAIQVRGNVNNILIKNCVVHDSTTASGIDIYLWDGGRPHHVTINGCTAYNCPKFAGYASEQADYLTIESNISYNNAYGLDIGSGSSNIIMYNTVYNCTDLGIAISSNSNSLIYNNLVHDISGDGVAIYAYYWSAHQEPHTGNRYYNNISYNVNCGIFESNYKQPSGGVGISTLHRYYNNLFYNVGPCFKTPFWFHGATYIKFYNNTIYMNSNTDAIIFESGSIGHDVRNNIISISGSYSPMREDSSSQSGSTIDYNCYQNRSGTPSGPGSHSVLGDPMFVNVSNGNFKLAAVSPCIDSGSSDGDIPTTDFDGNSRCDDPSVPNVGGGFIPYFDIGAYEYPCVDITPPAPPKRLRILY